MEDIREFNRSDRFLKSRTGGRGLDVRCCVLDDPASTKGACGKSLLLSGAALVRGGWLGSGGRGRFERISEVEGSPADCSTRPDFSPERCRGSGADFDPLGLLSLLLDSAMKVTVARRGLVVIRGPDGGLRADVLAGSWSSSDLADRFAARIGIIQLLDKGTSRVSSGTRSGDVLGGRGGIVKIGSGTAACVPLRVEGRVVGLIYLGGRKRGSALTKLDVELLEAVGQHAALVLASFRLHRRIRQVQHRLGGAGAAPDRIRPSRAAAQPGC